jgi:hypothetical protein
MSDYQHDPPDPYSEFNSDDSGEGMPSRKTWLRIGLYLGILFVIFLLMWVFKP